MEDKQVTTNEIMGLLHEQMEFLQDNMVVKEDFNNLKDQVSNLDTKVQSLDTKVQSLDTKVQNIDTRVQNLEVKVNQVKLDLLDAMDEKFGALKGDLVVMMRSEDRKLVALIEILKKKRVLEEDEAGALLALHPFPQASI